MTRRSQKQEEWYDFKLFEELLRSKLREILTYTKLDHKEDPDFRITQSTSVLGIEHTQLFFIKTSGDHHTPAAEDSFRKKIVQEAKKCCEEKGVPPLWVKIFFNDVSHLKSRKDKDSLVNDIAKFVEQQWRCGKLSFRNELKIKNRNREVFYMTISPGVMNGKKWLDEHLWQPHYASEVDTNFTYQLQETIHKKGEKYQDYLENCEECWLLIVVDRRNPAQRFGIEFDKNAQANRYQSKFARVFYMDTFERHLVELQTR